MLAFANDFETRFVGQGAARRSLDETFDVAWSLLGHLPREELLRIPSSVLDTHWRPTDGPA
jgi:V/A-type H+-transporting ATPase subunit B